MTRPTAAVRIKVLRLKHADGLALPAYQSADAAGMDLVAALAVNEPVKLEPGARALIPTGLAFELPPGTEAQVRPRSGLAIKHGVTVLNSPGTIDADYRGEVSVILINHGAAVFTVSRGDRIAQIIFAPVNQAKLVAVRSLNSTARGAGGFGSTGVEPAKPRQARAPKKPARKGGSGANRRPKPPASGP